jgi:malate dehydrogenase (oxaloacetate-decarboxylating)
MPQASIDTVVRLRLHHLPGQLARVAKVVGDGGGLVGDLATIGVGELFSIRDITIETTDEAHTERIVANLRAMPDVQVLAVTDRVFAAHEGGKIGARSRVELAQIADMRSIYTPGVARVARAIAADRSRAWELTALGRSIAICTNGSRVLGLGDIGALASLPVMEGKAVFYDKFANLSATPILVDTKDPMEFVDTVVRVSQSFGGIHLEDIRVPDCFTIENELRRRLAKPVMHDDQHGTATAALAAIVNACAMTNLELKKARLGQIGLGAAGSAIARIALAFGVGEVLVTDVSKDAMATLAAEGARATDLRTLLAESDIVVATTGKPGLIKVGDVRNGQVIFALSNPDPEIDPHEARRAGAAFAGDGRSINNALAFPGLFGGALDVKSRAITPKMRIAAALAIAAKAGAGEVVPGPLDPSVHASVRRAVADAARGEGLENTATW